MGDGIYTRWINEGLLVDWLIIDCHATRPRKRYALIELFRNIFTDERQIFRILSSGGLFFRFALMS